jgi:hypothetical protein
MGKPTPVRGGGLMQCQGDHDDYVCLRGGVAMSSGDGTGSNTQVPGARSTLVPVATSYHARL